MKKYRDQMVSVGVTGSEYLTKATERIRFTANPVSRAMDTAGGGVSAHGGFHRIFGGHSVADLEMWREHGLAYPVELAKDTLTSNGIPLPGAETIANHGSVNVSSIQDWGCLNIGDMAADTIGCIDTMLSLRKFRTKRAEFAARSTRSLIKGSVKIATATTHGNLPLALLGACDIGMSLYSKLESQVALDFSEMGNGACCYVHGEEYSDG